MGPTFTVKAAGTTHQLTQGSLHPSATLTLPNHNHQLPYSAFFTWQKLMGYFISILRSFGKCKAVDYPLHSSTATTMDIALLNSISACFLSSGKLATFTEVFNLIPFLSIFLMHELTCAFSISYTH